MAHDALDPGPDGSYPYWPRRADGSWDTQRMPTGVSQTPGGVPVDLTPRHADGTPIVPPDLA